MLNSGIVPLIIHGHVLWAPAARTRDPDQPSWFPLIGEVRYEHLLLAPNVSPHETPVCPVIAATTTWQKYP